MGRDIERKDFTDADFVEFQGRLADETGELERWFADDVLDDRHWIGGFELEAWLTDAAWSPAPLNEELLQRLQAPLLTHELARFNVELNTAARPLEGGVLGLMQRDLDATWDRCRAGAEDLGAHLLMVGILPTVKQSELNSDAMTPIARYAALNEQILRQREGRALSIDICGRERLQTEHPDVMLESAATSFQIHIQVPASRAADYYNASLLVSAPMVAISANSPYLFGHDLWAETRIPLFEQAVEAGGYRGASHGPLRRVGFGNGFVRESLMECFRENLDHFPPILPMHFDGADAGPMAHLQLHNGTIWRWNRPLVGTDEGQPHVRIEHRAVPGGPSVIDEIANAAFYYGLVHYHANRPEADAPDRLLPFARVRDNFYACARYGLEARVHWGREQPQPVAPLLRDHLAGCARSGLRELGLDPAEIDHYVDVVTERTRCGFTGAGWQRAWVERNGRDMKSLTAAYAARQAEGAPVHSWGVDD